MALKKLVLNGSPRVSNLTSMIVEELGSAIVSGAYGQHNPLPNEGVLCEKFGTSHGTVREAIRVLAAKSLVGARPRHGTWVEPDQYWNWLDPDVLRWSRERTHSAPLLKELTELRLAMEPMAAFLAATTSSRDDKEKIRHAYIRLENADIPQQDAETAFHLAVAQASNNRFFSQLGGATASAIRVSFQLLYRHRHTREIDFDSYRRICDAILENDPNRAEREMRDMIQATLDTMGQPPARPPSAEYTADAMP